MDYWKYSDVVLPTFVQLLYPTGLNYCENKIQQVFGLIPVHLLLSESIKLKTKPMFFTSNRKDC